MTKPSVFFLLIFTLFVNDVTAQIRDSTELNKEFSSLEKALKNPKKVYRLNLSEQKLELPDTVWSKFSNLQYLSLKNDHLEQIPLGITYLKNLKVLDLSGNDFQMLPSSFSNLTNLQELYLNDEKKFRFDKNISILSTLPNLKSLHIENDGLNSLPSNIVELN